MRSIVAKVMITMWLQKIKHLFIIIELVRNIIKGNIAPDN